MPFNIVPFELFFVLFILFYFVPTIVAFYRSHHNKVPIFLLNFFAGWTFIGWVASLVWSFTSPPPQDE